MAGSAWKRMKAVLTSTRAGSPCADVLVAGPEPMDAPDGAGGPRVRAKKRALLLSGLVEAASRRRPKL
jgi:hypothetical protein